MAKLPKIMPVTELRTEAAAAIRHLQKSKGPVVITQRGRAAAVLMSVEAYESGEHERKLLRDLLRGEKEIAAGDGHDLDDVLADADELLGKP